MKKEENIENKKNEIKEISKLGMGCMRFPRKGISIDQVKTEELLEKALSLGINYFDTAYIYPGSEKALGTFIKKKKREDFYITTKMPQYMIKKEKDLDTFFEKQLENLKTNYVDFYLFHMLADVEDWERLKNFGIENWIEEKKEKGQIKNIGFSFHGKKEEFKKLIDVYPWEITMIQYNYLDENNQAGTEGIEYAYKKGIPVVVMEPLRGGTLGAKLPEEVKKLYKKEDAQKEYAEWAMGWLRSKKEVRTILSGMTTVKDIEENHKVIMSKGFVPFGEKEKNIIKRAVEIIREKTKVPCTGCGYCMPCPFGVDIPTCFSSYNERYTLKTKNPTIVYVRNTAAASESPANSGRCTGCQKCVEHCPQQIDIPKELNTIKEKTERTVFKTAVWVMKKAKK